MTFIFSKNLKGILHFNLHALCTLVCTKNFIHGTVKYSTISMQKKKYKLIGYFTCMHKNNYYDILAYVLKGTFWGTSNIMDKNGSGSFLMGIGHRPTVLNSIPNFLLGATQKCPSSSHLIVNYVICCCFYY